MPNNARSSPRIKEGAFTTTIFILSPHRQRATAITVNASAEITSIDGKQSPTIIPTAAAIHI
jgi:hypothetical protein